MGDFMNRKACGKASNFLHSKGRIVNVDTCTSNGYYVQGIKGGHPFKRIPGIGHYNGYGAIKVYEKYQRNIYLVVCVYRDNGTTFAVDVDVKDALMKHYGYKRYSEQLLSKAISDLRGKKIYVYYDDTDNTWKLSYPVETLWYSDEKYREYTCSKKTNVSTVKSQPKKKIIVRLKKRGENKDGINTRTV